MAAYAVIFLPSKYNFFKNKIVEISIMELSLEYRAIV